VISNTVQEIDNQIDRDVKVELVFIPRDHDIIFVEAESKINSSYFQSLN
jgi:hypothetical protein